MSESNDSSTITSQDLSCYFRSGVYSSNDISCSVVDLARLAKNKSASAINMDELRHNLYNKCWDHNDEDLSPITVTTYIKMRKGNCNSGFGDHVERILHADISYPIIIDPDYNILDGCHRLCKYYLDEVESVQCVMLTFDELYSICGLS